MTSSHRRAPIEASAQRSNGRAREKSSAGIGKVTAWLPSTSGLAELSRELEMDEARVPKLLETFAKAGLLYRFADLPKTLTGLEFHARFSAVLDSWLGEAFSHPFWARMMNGTGSARLFTGWLIELYHYTKNANRHMPLSCALAHEKPIKQLRAKHYAEEWNHFHYFAENPAERCWASASRRSPARFRCR